MTITPQRALLPMAGNTHGNRSAVTCHLRCGDACFMDVPNTTETSYFRDVAASSLKNRSLSRRTVLGATAATAATSALVHFSPAAAATPARVGATTGRAAATSGLVFSPIAAVPASVDNVSVPAGHRWDAILRWGDPIFADAPEFDPHNQSAAAQAMQFGYNCDYLDIIVTDRKGTRAQLVTNHEYTNENIMFPTDMDPAELIRTAWAAHGMSVVELRRVVHGHARGHALQPADQSVLRAAPRRGESQKSRPDRVYA